MCSAAAGVAELGLINVQGETCPNSKPQGDKNNIQRLEVGSYIVSFPLGET